jgi:hypothetical protein
MQNEGVTQKTNTWTPDDKDQKERKRKERAQKDSEGSPTIYNKPQHKNHNGLCRTGHAGHRY